MEGTDQKTKPDFREQIDQINTLKEIFGSYISNGLAKPIYSVQTIRERKPAKSDDTISRLEALMTPPEEYKIQNLEGVFLPLSQEEDGDWICILFDGTILKLRPPDNPDLFKSFTEEFYHAPIIKVPNIDNFKRYPSDRFMYGKVVYRNDVVINDEVRQQIEKDVATAKEVALKRQELINKQKQDSIKIFIEAFGGNKFNSPSPPK